MTQINVKKDVWERLTILKYKNNFSSLSDLIDEMILIYLISREGNNQEARK